MAAIAANIRLRPPYWCNVAAPTDTDGREFTFLCTPLPYMYAVIALI
jgi:hypothetical protein